MTIKEILEKMKSLNEEEFQLLYRLYHIETKFIQVKFQGSFSTLSVLSDIGLICCLYEKGQTVCTYPSLKHLMVCDHESNERVMKALSKDFVIPDLCINIQECKEVIAGIKPIKHAEIPRTEGDSFRKSGF